MDVKSTKGSSLCTYRKFSPFEMDFESKDLEKTYLKNYIEESRPIVEKRNLLSVANLLCKFLQFFEF